MVWHGPLLLCVCLEESRTINAIESHWTGKGVNPVVLWDGQTLEHQVGGNIIPRERPTISGMASSKWSNVWLSGNHDISSQKLTQTMHRFWGSAKSYLLGLIRHHVHVAFVCCGMFGKEGSNDNPSSPEDCFTLCKLDHLGHVKMCYWAFLEISIAGLFLDLS